MEIDEALKITGFSLCEFKADDGDVCESCEKEMSDGENVYYERTSYECDEGAYHCESCVTAKPEEWKAQAEYYEKMGNELFD